MSVKSYVFAVGVRPTAGTSCTATIMQSSHKSLWHFLSRHICGFRRGFGCLRAEFTSARRSADGLKDWAAETPESISARLEGAKAAQAQTRLTLGAMAIISVMMLIAAYNAYLSYDYWWIVDKRCPKLTGLATKLLAEIPPEQSTPMPAERPTEQLAAVDGPKTLTEQPADVDRMKTLTEQAYRDWASSRTVMISLLGIRVSVDDAAVLGTAVLLVLSLWLLLVSRRENHTIGFLLRDTDAPLLVGNRAPPGGRSEREQDSSRWLIYHTITSNSLFVLFDHLPYVFSLSGPNSLAATRRKGGGPFRVVFKLIRYFFFLFPVIASLAVFVVDSLSYSWLPDPFDAKCETDNSTSFFQVSRAVFFACWVTLMICCLRSSWYSTATERVLRKYGRRLYNSLKRKQSAKG